MKIRCTNPQHVDETPSMEVYEDAGWCFVCNYLDRNVGEPSAKRREPEDIQHTIRIIQELPIRGIRGLSFRASDDGYYIVWPRCDFYKFRPFDGRGLRYKGPIGHQAPLFNLGPNSDTLVLVEGEINALSLSETLKTRSFTIASPGSCNEFMRHLLLYQIYHDIVIIVDHDAAGVASGIGLKKELTKRGKRVQLITCKKDINQMLQDGGTEEVKKWWEENVALLRRV